MSDQNKQDKKDDKKDHGDHKIKFTIDKHSHEIKEDQNPVTGEFLRSLEPVVPEDYDLFKRAHGHEDDLLVKPEDNVTVKNGDHFFTSKRVLTNGGI